MNTPINRPIPELFAAQVERAPEAIAVEWEAGSITYAELDRRSNAVAATVLSNGSTAGARVGVFLERSVDLVVALVGILKAGAVYVPLDPTYPVERLSLMMDDASVAVVLTHAALRGALPTSSVPTLNVDGIGQAAARLPPDVVPSSPESLAYIIYTSGSTGRPKGVCVPHRAIPRLALNTDYVELGPGDRIAQASNASFDAATFEIWGALLTGATLVIIPKAVAVSPRELSTRLLAARINTLFLTTALFNQIAEATPAAFRSLRYVLFGGEAVDPRAVRRILEAGAPGRLLHVYGPTETTTFAMWHHIREVPANATTIPIGKGLAKTSVYLLNENLEEVGRGEQGEVFIGGNGVAHGYWLHPAMTAEKFLPDPWSDEPGARLYRTGDRGRRDADGAVEFLGRADHQIKLRGYRIELPEIEAVVRQHRAVDDAVVLARDGPGGEKRLVAYFKARSGSRIAVDELRHWLRAKLPDYMVPAAFVTIDVWPLNANGKIYREVLPEPVLASDRNVVAPKGGTEESIARIFAEVLELEEVGANDDFFDLGGHSLLANGVMTRIRSELGVDLPVRALFDAPTIAELAQQVERRRTAPSPEPQLLRSRRERAPLSSTQRRMWFLEQSRPPDPAYQVTRVYRLRRALDLDALQRALVELTRRHEILRTTYEATDGVPEQVIGAPGTVIELPYHDLRTFPAEKREALAERVIYDESRAPIDLARGPVLRAQALTLSDADHRLVMTVHHIAFDGWSAGILLRELSTLYDAFARREPAQLRDLPFQFADYAISEQEQAGQAQEDRTAYWRKQITGSVPLEFPLDRPRPRVRSFAGARCPMNVDAKTTARLRDLGGGEVATLFVVLIAGVGALLSRYARQNDITLGIVTANRSRPELESLIGAFVNTLPLRLDLSGCSKFSVVELIQHVRTRTLEAYEHELSLDRIVDISGVSRDPGRNPLFDVCVVLQNTPRLIEASALELVSFDIDRETAMFDITLSLEEVDGGLVGWFEYTTAVFDRTTVERIAGHLGTLLRAMAGDPAQRLSTIPMLTEEERRRFLHDWNDTAVEFEGPPLVHLRIEEQVRRTPEATAVSFESASLTYRQLNQRANQLAHRLRRLGVGPDVLVGVCVDRSLDLVVALLAILKAGGAYVPLDPSYPEERLRYMMTASAVLVLLTKDSLEKRLRTEVGRVVRLDTDATMWADESVHDLSDGRVSPEHLFCAIYTSGSTGQPKGVTSTHRGISNRLLWMQRAFALDETDAVVQKTPFSFDVSVWEFFWPLMYGARLVVAAPEGHRDPVYLARLIQSERVTTSHFVPSMLRAFLVEPCARECTSLRRVICSGEELTYQLKERFFEVSRAELHNLYGPTEASVDVSWWKATTGAKTVPIGRPIANTQLYVLDSEMQAVPAGVAGDLYIGGVQLARGYLHRGDLTADRFLPDPFGPCLGGRIYRTGDLARWVDGELEFIGRADRQIKLRGFRIELPEIESVLAAHEGVAEAVVTMLDDGAEEKRLVAYVVPDAVRARVVKLRDRYLGSNAYELPNGMMVAQTNKNETEFLYREIFEDGGYSKEGFGLDDGAVVFDVGANIGLFTLFVNARVRDARIYAFEPIPPIFDLLKANAELYDVKGKVFACGLGSEASRVTFTYYPHNSILSGRFADASAERDVLRRYVQNEAVPTTEQLSDEALDEVLTHRLASETVDCPIRTISDVMRDEGLDRIDLLKVDVEKAEWDVLAGIEAADWPKIRQVIVEVHDLDGRLALVKAFLSERGFDVAASEEPALQGTGLYAVHARRATTHRPSTPSGLEAASLPKKEWYGQREYVSDLRLWVGRHLPAHMVPSAWVVLERVPTTPSGKADRKALPSPDVVTRTNRFVAPRTPLEQTITEIWRDVLHAAQVGIEDNFFELGGHSLFATQVIARLRKHLGVDLPVRTMFEAPTVARLAERVEQSLAVGRTEEPPLAPVERTARLPLSFAELRLWFMDQYDPGLPSYNLPFGWRLEGPIDEDALESALSSLVARHESLRTRFVSDGGEPVRVVDPPSPVPLQRVSVERMTEQQRDEVLTREARRPFDLAKGPLFRATLLKIARADHLLLCTTHHVVFDGWSLGVLARELSALYGPKDGRRPANLPPLPLQYADYACWQRESGEGGAMRSELEHWKKQLARVEVLELPTDRARLDTQDSQGALAKQAIPKELLDDLRALSRREGVSLFVLTFAAFSVLLARWSGQRNFAIGLPIAGRTHLEVEGLVGLFVNTLALPTHLEGDPTVQELLVRVREQMHDAHAHQRAPFERIVEELQPARDPRRHPIFQVMLAMQNYANAPLAFPEVRATPLDVDPETSMFDLSADVLETPSGLQILWEYSTGLFAPDTIQRMSMHLERLFRGFVDAPRAKVFELPLLAEDERALVASWNAPRLAPRRDACIHTLFEEQVDRTPDATAVVFDGRQLTYRELDERANRLAHRLRRMGVAPGVLVALCLERSLELMVSILAILKAGGAYLPLDPAYPPKRLAVMIQDGRPRVVVTLRGSKNKLAPAGSSVLVVDDEEAILAKEPAARPTPLATTRDLAYTIYTSGSTGQPKGVQVEHGSLVNFARAMTRAWNVTSADRVLQFTTINWDTSAEEIWPCLTTGATLVLRTEAMLDPSVLVEACHRDRLTVLDFSTAYVPEFVRALEQAEVPPSLRLVQFGGDRVNLDSILTWQRVVGDRVTLIHGYGVTEGTAMLSTCDLATQRDSIRQGVAPIGTPIENTRAYVLDAALQPVPPGVFGELCIGGICVARGYLRHPELTAQVFVPDPFAPDPGARMYRTGDVARFRSDGVLEFVGRRDHQLKVRGVRIELAEVEAAIRAHPNIREAVVVAPPDAMGATRLVAYVVTDPATGADEVRAFAKQQVPAYMVPTVVVLEAVPLLPNGKVDRRALPPPPEVGERPHVEPLNDVERDLARLWCDVLQVARVSASDNFFDVGGHSLLATRLIARIRKAFDIDLPLRAIFDAPELSALSARIAIAQAEGRAATVPLNPTRRPDRIPLSYAQEVFWRWEQAHPGSRLWCDTTALRLHGTVHNVVLERTINELVRRHEALRTTFPLVDGSPAQVIAPAVHSPLPVVNLQGLAPEMREAGVARVAAEQHLDVAEGPLFRACLVRLGEDDHVLLLTTHHLACDGPSSAIILEELRALYEAFEGNQPSPLPNLPVQVADVA